MNTYIPEMKALWMAENVIASLHNIYTLFSDEAIRGVPFQCRLTARSISEVRKRLEGLDLAQMPTRPIKHRRRRSW